MLRIRLPGGGVANIPLSPEDDTVGTFADKALRVTGYSCEVESADDYLGYGPDYLLQNVELPFIVRVGDEETLVEELPPQSMQGSLHKGGAANQGPLNDDESALLKELMDSLSERERKIIDMLAEGAIRRRARQLVEYINHITVRIFSMRTLKLPLAAWYYFCQKLHDHCGKLALIGTIGPIGAMAGWYIVEWLKPIMDPTCTSIAAFVESYGGWSALFGSVVSSPYFYVPVLIGGAFVAGYVGYKYYSKNKEKSKRVAIKEE